MLPRVYHVDSILHMNNNNGRVAWFLKSHDHTQSCYVQLYCVRPTGTCYVAYQLTPIFVTIYYKLKLDCGKSLF